jgi:ComF family protein
MACLWPHSCFVCGESAAGCAVCARCSESLPRLSALLCPVCALPVAVAGMACGRCQRHRPHFDASFAVFAYAHPVREMLLALKHGQGFALLEYLSAALGEVSGALAVDAVLAAPLHARRLSERGFNQAHELARLLAREAAIPLWREAVLREQATPRLAGLHGRQRRRTMRGAFRCVADCSGLHVLVIDDVMTTGATLNELARTLKQAGAARVTNLVVARTLPRS